MFLRFEMMYDLALSGSKYTLNLIEILFLIENERKNTL